MARTTCKAHCAACGRHFGGTRAFDLHRAGSHAAGDRYCLAPGVDTDRLEALSDDGWCKISGEHVDGVPRTLHPVTIRARARTVEDRARLASLSDREAPLARSGAQGRVRAGVNA